MNEDENIVVCDLLCYMYCKIDSVPKETLVQVITSFYKQDAIVTARELLYKDIPDNLPRVKRDNVGAMYDVMQELVTRPHPVFVCRDLNNVPPLSLKNIDPVMLLQQTSEVKVEMNGIKENQRGLQSQLEEIKASLAALCDVSPRNGAPRSYGAAASGKYHPGRGSASKRRSSEQASSSSTGDDTSRHDDVLHESQHESTSDAGPHEMTRPDPVAPCDPPQEEVPEKTTPTSKESVETVGGRFAVDDEGFYHRVKRDRRVRRQHQQVIGKGQQQRLRAARVVRRRDIFVTRLHENTTEEEVAGHVTEATGVPALLVEKLKSKYPGYASFRVVCEEAHLATLMSEETWDEGIMVRPFYVAKVRGPVSSHSQSH